MTTTASGRLPVPAGCWRTAKGLDIPIQELEDSHLLKILRILQKKASYICALKVVAYFKEGLQPSGTGACDAYDQEFDTLCGLSWRDCVQSNYKELEQEALKRGLYLPQPPPATMVALEAAMISKMSAVHTSDRS